MSEQMFLDPPALHSIDSLPVRTTTSELLNLTKVQEHITTATRSGRYQGPTDPMTYLLTKRCLVAVGNAVYATLAGLLCFGHRPQDVFPHAVVDIGHYRGIQTNSMEVLHLEKNISGTIPEQIARVESYLWTNTHHGMTLDGRGAQRVEIHEYPQAVIRELIVNMLAHRDYANFLSAARVQLYNNRIEWVSPGGLPEGITVENILAAQLSRNPVILSILYEGGYVEAFGQGLDTVVAVLEREAMAPPKFEDNGACFIATVYGRALDAFTRTNGLAQLTDSQRRILTLLRASGTLTPRDLREQLAERSERSLQRDIRELIANGFIESVGGGRAMRYRLINDDS